MTIRSLLDAALAGQASPTLSYELFPPRTPGAEDSLMLTMGLLAATNPDFMSITYGASGTTRTTSRAVVHELALSHTIPPLAHLTCVDQSRADLVAVIETYLADGVRDFLALRLSPAWDKTVLPALEDWVAGKPVNADRYKAARDKAVN